jgi:antitoxin component of RelBE/YafQ-DinJ toxin-antitoxin module
VKTDEIKTRVSPDLKLQATLILRNNGVTLSDYVRESLVQVVDHKGLPFPVRTATGLVESGITARLKKTFAPELAIAERSQTNAGLMSALRKERAKAKPDADTLARIEGDLKALRAQRVSGSKAGQGRAR